eukprot:873398-Rhodomonas_salina.3
MRRLVFDFGAYAATRSTVHLKKPNGPPPIPWPGTRYHMLLRACYALSGTDLACAATRSARTDLACAATCSTDIAAKYLRPET